MAWQTDRNYQLDGASTELRAIQFVIKLKEVLDTAGWTIVGYGDGVDDSGWDLGGVTDTFPAFPSTTGMDDGCWFAAESASGAQVVFQKTAAANADVAMWWSASGAYDNTGIGHSTRAGDTGTPADEIDQSGANIAFGGTTGVSKQTIAYTDDAESFIVFGRIAAKDEFRGFFIKLEDFRTGDTIPFVATWYAEAAADTWASTDLETPTANEVLGWHPDGAEKEYAFSNVSFDSVNIMTLIGPDPVSGDDQLIDVLLGCQIVGYYHIRGKVSGIVRAPDGRASGDKYASNKWMQIGSFAIDGWNSTDSLES
jgi:hypothetical protein